MTQAAIQCNKCDFCEYDLDMWDEIENHVDQDGYECDGTLSIRPVIADE